MIIFQLNEIKELLVEDEGAEDSMGPGRELELAREKLDKPKSPLLGSREDKETYVV